MNFVDHLPQSNSTLDFFDFRPTNATQGYAPTQFVFRMFILVLALLVGKN